MYEVFKKLGVSCLSEYLSHPQYIFLKKLLGKPFNFFFFFVNFFDLHTYERHQIYNHYKNTFLIVPGK